MPVPKLIFTVTNDLNFDQRMIRICNSLHEAGYDVTLVGRKWTASKPLRSQPFRQKRLFVKPTQGKIMYLLYWIRLFFYLMTTKADLLCAIDLDTILPVYLASRLKGCRRVYDAHELFTEMKEVVTRPREKFLWDTIEKFTVPRFPNGYTIGDCYADYFQKKYGVSYAVVRNATVLKDDQPDATVAAHLPQKYILYQGWVNKGRCFEELIPAMQWVDLPLIVCGEGNFYQEAVALTRRHHLQDKIHFQGYLAPSDLIPFTRQAYIGVTLFHGISESNRLSMANRFFDYMHHGVPQVCMNFPEYRKVNEASPIAVLVDDPPTPAAIAAALNRLIADTELHARLRANAYRLRQRYCWQNEEKTLVSFYQKICPLS